MDTSDKRPPSLSLSNFPIPRYRYYPADLIKKLRLGPEQWERMRILQACERLEIPHELWPKIAFPMVQSHPAVHYRIPRAQLEQFNIPPFLALEETISEWKRRCHICFDKYLQEYADKFESQFQNALRLRIYTKIPQTRDTTPFELRYEWAAKKWCYKMRYKELAKDGYTTDRIKQAVLQILKDAGLKNGK
jgi:hypothetical protein